MSPNDGEHLVEVREGVGEPWAMRFRQGSEIGPLSIGRSAEWRISALSVLDIHGYLYFDGSSLFLRSADRAMPLAFKGAPIPTEAWTPIEPPGAITLGGAQLWYAPDPATAVADAGPNSEKTRLMDPLPRAEPDRARPFAKGTFSAIADEDSGATRLEPIEQIAAARAKPPAPRPAAGAPATPAAGMPIDPSAAARAHAFVPQQAALPGGMRAPVGPVIVMGPDAPPAIAPVPPMAMPNVPAGAPIDPSRAAYAPTMLAPTPVGPVAISPPAMAASSMLPAVAPMGPPPGLAQPPPNPYAAPPAQAAARARSQGPFSRIGKQWRNATPVQRMISLLLPFAFVAVWYAAAGDEPPPPPQRTPAPASNAPREAAKSAIATKSADPVPKPPTSSAAPPSSAPTTSSATPPPSPPTAAPAPTASAHAPRPRASASAAASAPPRPNEGSATAMPAKKTLERTAADAVATGAYEQAAALYDQLAKDRPKDPVYAETARIVRGKMAATPPK